MNKDQNKSLALFLQHKKPAFQRLGHFGCIASASILAILAVFFVVGMTQALSYNDHSVVHAWAGPMQWRYTGASFLTAFMRMVSVWGPLCFNAVLLYRLFCNYKKGQVFSPDNSRSIVILGLFNLFLGNIQAGLFAMVLSIILPDTESS